MPDIGLKMTDAEYRANPAISRSELWRLRRSPEIFKYFKDYPEEPTEALLFGQVFHKFVLEPDTFNDEFTFEPDCDRRTKEGKAIYDLFLESVGNRTIVPRKMMGEATLMGQLVRDHPLASKLLKGEAEKVFFWTDRRTKVKCKCRTDMIRTTKDNIVVVDLKTCTDASTEAFTREAVKYGYDFQAAFYSEGVKENLGKYPKFVFIAVEKKPPYAINVMLADDAFIDRGRQISAELLDTYKDCKKTKLWYGYNGPQNTINTLSLPSYLMAE